MLQSMYGRGTVATSKCTLAALNQFLKTKKREGCFLYFIQDPVKGVIVGEETTSVAQAVEAGQTAVMRFKKSPNMIVARKLRPDEISNGDGVETNHLTHAYDVISVCTSQRGIPAQHTVARISLAR